MFDWVRFLDGNHVPYKTTGREQIGINCPFCPDDPSLHMSINLEGRGWRCWRQPAAHYGRNPNRLVAAILHVPISVAASITGSNTFIPVNFLERVTNTLTPKEHIPPKPLKLPQEFRSLTPSVAGRAYNNYLLNRGYTLKQIIEFTRYGMYYCTRGPYSGRILFTVIANGRLVTWTGRTVSRRDTLRYRTLSPDPDKAADEGMQPALGPITDYLLWYDELTTCDADTIVIGEGPFDALRIRVLGRQDGIVGTCLFTSNITAAQINLLETILPRFKRRILALDRNTMPTALRIQTQLGRMGLMLRMMPEDLKDPGELKDRAALRSLVL